jgi:hypothetical protein
LKKILSVISLVIIAVIAIGLPITSIATPLIGNRQNLIGGSSSSIVTISRAGISSPEVQYGYISSPLFLVASPTSGSSISLNWIPSIYANSTLVRYKTGTYPVNNADGTVAYSGNLNYKNLTGLASGVTYYFTAFGVSQWDGYSTTGINSIATTPPAYPSSPDLTLPGDSGVTPDVSAYSGKFWYPLVSWLGSAWQLTSPGIALRLFGMFMIALISICIAYGTGDLLVTLLSTVVMLALANMMGIVPFWAILIYGIISGSVAYVKGNSHA